jgi:hypothetical protein
MRLTEALTRVRHEADLSRRPAPTFTADRETLRCLAKLIEDDLGCRMYDGAPHPRDGFEFCGMKFEPA